MKRWEIFLVLMKIPVDYILLLAAGLSAYALRFSGWAVALKPVAFEITAAEYMAIISGVATLWLLIFAFSGLYSFDANRKFTEDISRILTASLMGLAIVAVYILFTQDVFDSRFLVAASWGLAVAYIIAGRLLIRGVKALLYRAGLGARRVIVVGSHSTASQLIATLQARPELGYTVIGQVRQVADDTVAEILDAKPDEVIVMNPRANEAETVHIMEVCTANHIVFKYSAGLFDAYSSRIEVYPLAGMPIVEIKPTPLDGWGRVVKRLFDITVSLLMIVIISPILLVVTVITLIETGRPVIYKNERVGIRGRHFFTYKFRSMYQKDSTGSQFGDSGQAALEQEARLIKERNTRTGPIYKIGDDPRVTPFGQFIRRWSIDELPQFVNVLKGEMSIVGPRPHQPREVEGFAKSHRTALILKPGITGLAQISGRSDLSYEDEMKLDVFYIEHWSAMLDLIVFLKTPFIVLKKRKVV